LGGYLHGLWQSGALFGSTAEQAYFVRCDETTNTPETIDQGKLIVEVGLAPVKPAEFVRSEEHTSELQSRENLVCRLLLETRKWTIPLRTSTPNSWSLQSFYPLSS